MGLGPRYGGKGGGPRGWQMRGRVLGKQGKCPEDVFSAPWNFFTVPKVGFWEQGSVPRTSLLLVFIDFYWFSYIFIGCLLISIDFLLNHHWFLLIPIEFH